MKNDKFKQIQKILKQQQKVRDKYKKGTEKIAKTILKNNKKEDAK